MTPYYKMRQIFLQNVTAILLQNVAKTYYKMRRVFYYKMRQLSYKMQQFSQKCDDLISKCDINYKLRRCT